MSSEEEVVAEKGSDDSEEIRQNNDEDGWDINKKVSWRKFQMRNDSLDLESRHYSNPNPRSSHRDPSMSIIMHLAFQSIGVVYGDIGTSPLYVYAGIFTNGINNHDDILGALCLIFYAITLIPLTKYVFIVLRANDNGDGGTFALYSLICRYAKVALLPNQQMEDEHVSNYQLELPTNKLKRASKIKSRLENSHFAKIFLLLVAMLGTSMVIGDGVLTPCISVVSAVIGIKQAASSITDNQVVMISIAILVCLFMVQRFGTDKVGYSFAPIICVWFTFIAGIGVYNFIKYDPSVIKALNPKYMIDYFKRNKKDAWISLGGVVLAITGCEALFADVGHFTVRSIQISMGFVAYPALIMAYAGQASFLRKHSELVANTFYDSIPKPLYWPMFVVAVAAAIIASQAMISGTFSIIQQSLSLGCFPRVKIVHTSSKYEGQVYIPEINYLLMIACVAVTAAFKTGPQIGNAYGIAVVFVMTLTSALLVLIMLMIWKTHILLVLGYVLIFGSVELLYLSAVLYKFDQGGYLPLTFAAVLMCIMYIWNNVYRRKYYYELEHKISPHKVINEIGGDKRVQRIPGLAIFYSELVQGIPPIFKHYVKNVPALHSVLVFVSIKSLPISRVATEERFLFRRVEPKELNMFRCVVRYGYSDVHNEQESFQRILIERLKDFIINSNINTGSNGGVIQEEEEGGINELLDREIGMINEASQAGVVHLIGQSEVIATKGSGIGKKILINYAYNFLKRNLRQSDQVFDIPHQHMLKVGMTYEL